MRHRKHNHQLGRKKEHRIATMAALSTALITHGRIKTTLAKAKALRPFAERLVTLAKKGGLANRRLAASRIRSPEAVKKLFDERASEFTDRNGGYTRIYKLGNARIGDAAEMALIEFVPANDPGYSSSRRKGKGKGAKKSAAKAGPTPAKEGEEAGKEESATATAVAEEEPKAEAAEPAAEATGSEDAAPEKPEAEGGEAEKK